MKLKYYLKNTKNRLEKYYTISEDISYQNILFNIDAKFSAQETHTIITKNNVMDYSNSVEHVLFKYEPFLNYEKIQNYLHAFPSIVTKLTNPSRFHKSTIIKLVLITDVFDFKENEKKIQKIIKNFRFFKSYKFYFHGWTEGYVFVENLQTGAEFKSAGMKKVSYVAVDE